MLAGAIRRGQGAHGGVPVPVSAAVGLWVSLGEYPDGMPRSMFHDAVLELGKTEPASNGVVKTLDDICRLYGCWVIEENAAHFLKYKYFSAKQMDIITAEVSSWGRLRSGWES